MSDDTEEAFVPVVSTDDLVEFLTAWYHVPVLTVVVGFMFWVRVRTYENFLIEGDVYFSGNDPWYHYRSVQYTVRNWPFTMPFDAWTRFPIGTSVGQFGTFFDQLIATAALLIGLGSPTDQLVAKILLVTPAVIGALIAVPTFLIGKRLGGRIGGLFGVVVLALLPGTFLRRGLVGFADHHIAEVFFQTFAVLALMIAVTVAAREKPVYELVSAREFDAIRRPLYWSVLAGVATTMYLWTWPPGVLLVGIFAIYFVLQLTTDFTRGVSPDHLAFVGAVSMGTTGLLVLLTVDSFGFDTTTLSLLQAMLAIAVAAGAVFLAWLARQWESRSVPTLGYPGTVVGLIIITASFVFFVLPDVFDLIYRNILRSVGFGVSATARTIGEAQPFLTRANPQVGFTWTDVIVREYGYAFFTALLGVVILIAGSLGRRARLIDSDIRLTPARLLVIVWAVIIVAAAFTQVRFNYYLAVPVAVLNGYLVRIVIDNRWVGRLRPLRTLDDIKPYQVLTLIIVGLIVVFPLLIPVTLATTGQQAVTKPTVIQASSGNGPGAVTVWDEGLQWLKEETPREGTYGGADNEMPYYGTFARTDDFAYPDGAYGVISWWDYGHWITLRGERIPVANPFQQHATEAANYLLAQDEAEANAVIDGLGDEDERTRYVMVDWQMILPGSKFSAPTVFKADVSETNFLSFVYRQQGEGFQFAFHLLSQEYYQSQMVRLYLFHGSAMDPQPIVIDWDRLPGASDRFKQFPQGPNASIVRTFDSVAAAEEFVEQDRTAQIGGIGPYPSEPIPALQHYRLVHMTQTSALESARYLNTFQRIAVTTGVDRLHQTMPGWVKTFERVPGATIQGEGPPNTTVTARVEMHVPTTNSTFPYVQRAETGPDGTFTMTVPYATTGYDNWGPSNGYTNTSVRATGPYEFSTPLTFNESGYLVGHNATLHVPEGNVIGETDQPVTVTLTPQVVGEPETATGGNESTDRLSPVPADRELLEG